MPHKDSDKNRDYKRNWYRKNRPENIQCRECMEVKPRAEMSVVNEKKGQVRNLCKICDASLSRGWYAENKKKKKDYDLRRHFGITLEQYNRQLELQNGVCAICKRLETSKHQSGKVRDLAVDHCHTTGDVRGLLCSQCNKGLGNMKDDIRFLNAAIKYLLQGEDDDR